MLTDLPKINMHFHAHSAGYKDGDIVFLIEGSQAMMTAYNNGDEAVHITTEAAAVLRQKLTHRTRAFFYGGADGLVEIDIKNPAVLENPVPLAPGGRAAALAPAMKALGAQYQPTSEKPLHIILVTSGDTTDRYPDLRESMESLMMAPESQVLLDVVFTTLNHAPLSRVLGPVTANMLHGGADKNPDKPAPAFYQAFDADKLANTIAEAVNRRTSPDDPHKFNVDLVCDIFRRGTCTDLECPAQASFVKKGQHGHGK